MKKRHSQRVEERQLAESVEQVEEKLRKRAYELYELRDREDGRDLDDWLKAESEVSGNADRSSANRVSVSRNHPNGVATSLTHTRRMQEGQAAPSESLCCPCHDTNLPRLSAGFLSLQVINHLNCFFQLCVLAFPQRVS